MHHQLKTVDESGFAGALRLTPSALSLAVSRRRNAAFPEFRGQPEKSLRPPEPGRGRIGRNWSV